MEPNLTKQTKQAKQVARINKLKDQYTIKFQQFKITSTLRNLRCPLWEMSASRLLAYEPPTHDHWHLPWTDEGTISTWPQQSLPITRVMLIQLWADSPSPIFM